MSLWQKRLLVRKYSRKDNWFREFIKGVSQNHAGRRCSACSDSSCLCLLCVSFWGFASARRGFNSHKMLLPPGKRSQAIAKRAKRLERSAGEGTASQVNSNFPEKDGPCGHSFRPHNGDVLKVHFVTCLQPGTRPFLQRAFRLPGGEKWAVVTRHFNSAPRCDTFRQTVQKYASILEGRS